MPVTQIESAASDAQSGGAFPQPRGGTRRAEAVQRLQIGLFGLGAMLLIVALANIIMERAKETEAATVSPVAPMIDVPPPPVPLNDPLVDAGVVPDVPLPVPPANKGNARGNPSAAADRGDAVQKPR